MNNSTVTNYSKICMDTLGIDATKYDAFNDGMSAMLSQLRARLEKMFADQRDMERQFAEQMSGVAIERSVTAYNTGLNAANQNYAAARASAIGQIVAGGVGMAGGIAGGDHASSLAMSAGKIAEGGAGVYSAEKRMDAEKSQLAADFQRQSQQELQKVFDTIVERAAEISRQLHATSRDMNNLSVWISKV